MTTPRLYVSDAGAGRVVALPADEAHHVKNVLRLGTGAAVRIFDGRGAEWDGRVDNVSRAGVAVAVGAPVAATREPPVRVTLAIGLLKGEQMDDVVRDATMLGAAAIAPVTSAYVAASWSSARLESARERWRRVAIASARQCGRAVVPDIAPVRSFDAVLDAHRDDRVVICLEPGANASGKDDDDASARPESALLCVGPEGGWSAPEIARARSSGARLLQLGPRTLRAETAPVVALTSLWNDWGWS